MKHMQPGTIWKCIDEDDEMLNKFCVIKSIDDNPDHNGDGSIELLYSDGSRYYGKVRRFIPDYTHVYVKTVRNK